MEKMSIRPYEDRDWNDICRIHDRSRKTELERASLVEAFLPLEQVAEEEELFSYEHLEVAELEGKVVGFCAYTSEELGWLYVCPDKQGQGIGTAMMSHILEMETELYYIEVLLGNEPAKKLYEKFGFLVKEILSGKMPGNEKFRVQVYSMYRKEV